MLRPLQARETSILTRTSEVNSVTILKESSNRIYLSRLT